MAPSSSFAPNRAAANRSQPERANTRGPERTHTRTETRRLVRPHRGVMTDQTGLALDKTRIPEGYVMEWKRHTIAGAIDRRNLVIIQRHHWEPVPHKTQPHILGHTCTDAEEHIVVGGLGLYMRPAYLNEDAEEERMQETRYQIGQQLQALRLSSKEQVGADRTRITKQVVSVPQAVE